VAESSQLLVAALEKMSNAATPIATIVEQKMGSMQKDMMNKLNEKLDDEFSSFLTVMQQMLEKKGLSIAQHVQGKKRLSIACVSIKLWI
jgi:hypothetical protein